MKGDWRKLRELSRAELLVLAQAAALLPAVRLAQRFTRLDTLCTGLRRMSEPGSGSRQRRRHNVPVDKIARLVRIAADRGIIRPSCLQHSLVLWALLRRHGFDAAIRFGVRKNADALEAHSWVEFEGRVLNDVHHVGEQYLPFDRPVLSPRAKQP